MKLPEPVGIVTAKLGEHCSLKSNTLRKGDGIYSEAQLREALAQREAVMRQALEALEVIHDKSVFEYSLPSDHYASVVAMGAIKALEDSLK